MESTNYVQRYVRAALAVDAGNVARYTIAAVGTAKVKTHGTEAL